jgi:hypothetical protein
MEREEGGRRKTTGPPVKIETACHRADAAISEARGSHRGIGRTDRSNVVHRHLQSGCKLIVKSRRLHAGH